MMTKRGNAASHSESSWRPTTLSFAQGRILWLSIAFILAVWLSCSYFWLSSGWWDQYPIALSGFATVIGGILFSTVVDFDQKRALEKLHYSTVLDIASESWVEIDHRLKRISAICQLFAVGILLLFMIAGYVAWYDNNQLLKPSFDAKEIEFLVMSFVSAILVSCRIGRVAAHASILRAIPKSVALAPVIEHSDEVGGLGTVGRTILLQSSALMIPTLWLIAWIGFMQQCGDTDCSCDKYTSWRLHFVALLAFDIILVWPVCILFPLWSFRTAIVKWKTHRLKPIKRIARRELHALRYQTESTIDSRNEIAKMSAYIDQLNRFSNWPFSPSDLRRIIVPVVSLAAAALIQSLITL